MWSAPSVGLSLLLLVACAPATLRGAEPIADAVVGGEAGKQLDRTVRETVKDFWGAVLVASDGKILLARGYGFADGKRRPNTANTLFDIGSASKQLTAAAVLRLQAREKLKLDDPVGKHLDNVPEPYRKVTVRHLLSHTSGLPREYGFKEIADLEIRDRMVDAVLAGKPAAEPGERFQYSNANYFLLAAIIEKAAGTSFEKAMKEQVLGPAKLGDTDFVTSKDLPRERAAQRIYKYGPETRTADAIDYHWNWGNRGATGVVTTVADLHRWDRALRGDAVLDDKSREQMFAPVKATYGLGWFIRGDKGKRVAAHDGATGGYHASLVRGLDEDFFIAVVGKDDGTPGKVEQALTAALAKMGK